MQSPWKKSGKEGGFKRTRRRRPNYERIKIYCEEGAERGGTERSGIEKEEHPLVGE